MHDRLSALSDPEIVGLIKENFIAATDNDWYNRRRQDAIGEFFIKVADQGPRKAPGTRQGHYVFTPSGKLLGYNNNRTIDRRLKMIQEAIAKWDALPEAEKKPGAVDVPKLNPAQLDPKYHAELPKGGIALIASERILKVDDSGKLAQCEPEDHDHGWGHMAAIDHMWIQESEWKELLEADEIPDVLAKRMVRFHFLDFTRGEPAAWTLNQIKELKTSVQRIDENSLEIAGTFKTDAQTRGFDGEFLGKIELDENQRPANFDIVVLGNHFGDGPYTRGSRPGKTPLGIAFQLADPTKPEDKVRPQSSHSIRDYWAADR